MKEYELIIERNQPPCGGKSPKLHQFLEIQTEDPLDYVRQREPEASLDVSNDKNGDLVVAIGAGVNQIKYIFTEV